MRLSLRGILMYNHSYHRCACGQQVACQYGRSCPYVDGERYICDDCLGIYEVIDYEDELFEDEEFIKDDD